MPAPLIGFRVGDFEVKEYPSVSYRDLSIIHSHGGARAIVVELAYHNRGAPRWLLRWRNPEHQQRPRLPPEFWGALETAILLKPSVDEMAEIVKTLLKAQHDRR